MHNVGLFLSVAFLVNRVPLVCLELSLPLPTFQCHFLCKDFSLPLPYLQSILSSRQPLFLRVPSLYLIQTNSFFQLYPSLSQALFISLFLDS